MEPHSEEIMPSLVERILILGSLEVPNIYLYYKLSLQSRLVTELNPALARTYLT